jgi:hypothetical protein
VALAFVALLAAALVAFLLLRGDQAGEPSVGPRGIQTRLVLDPRVVLFGDTVAARIEVVLDRARIDPASLRVAADFEPWTPVGRPTRVVRDDGETHYAATQYVLRCLTAPCAPGRQFAPREYGPAQVTYTTRAGVTETDEVRWPVLLVNSRIVSDDFTRGDELSRPWRADLLSLPEPSYRLSPSLVLGVLLAGAGLFALAGLALLYAALPRRRVADPEPLRALEPDLTPLERALALLENGLPSDRADERRQALERLAKELAAHDAGLADQASTLAWAPTPPPVDEARMVAARVRTLLEERSEDATP